MNMNKKLWQAAEISAKCALPLLSFPAAQKIGVSISQLVHSTSLQAEVIEYVAKNTPTLAAVSLMDLSVEAEAFGAEVNFTDEEIPSVVCQLVRDRNDADSLQVPDLSKGRAGLCLETIRLVKQRITDKPVLAGVIGPFSLSGQLMDVSEILYTCYDEPKTVQTVVEKATDYLLTYVNAFKEVGAEGVVIAEPLAGLLSPDMCEEFSCKAIKRIVDTVQTDHFIVIYHNCGNITTAMLPKLYAVGAAAYHFGNAISMAEFLETAPANMLCMGNVDPAGQFLSGTEESIRQVTMKLMRGCAKYPNFIPSSGCDVPYHAKWENINAFFKAVSDYNNGVWSEDKNIHER